MAFSAFFRKWYKEKNKGRASGFISLDALEEDATMNTQTMTQQQIRRTGIEILGRHMGITGMIRFLQQSETGCGDYTKERDGLLGDPTLEQLVAEIQAGGWNEKK